MLNRGGARLFCKGMAQGVAGGAHTNKEKHSESENPIWPPRLF